MTDESKLAECLELYVINNKLLRDQKKKNKRGSSGVGGPGLGSHFQQDC